jgi:catechol 2,3-dioxygenase-like lactoylglutathione lyase family enzyme
MDGLVKGLVWVGSRTEHYGQMVRFYRDALGLPLEHEEGEFALFRLPDGSKGRSSAPPTPSTLTSPRDRSPVSWWTTSRVPAGVSRPRASSSSGPSTSGNLPGRRGRTSEPLTATSTR